MPMISNELQAILDQTAGLVLAGGQSTRMDGQNKALLKINGQTLLDHCLSGPLLLAATTLVSCGPHSYSISQTQLPDSGKKGPLEGIATGLRWLNQQPDLQWLATLPCDTPFVPRNWLIEAARIIASQNGSAIMTSNLITPAYYAHCGQRAHFAHAVWHKSALAHVETALTNNRLSLRGVLTHLNAMPLELNLPENDFSFFNINALADITTANQITYCYTLKK